jgi:hypothetical protein
MAQKAAGRETLSTTVARETYEFLEQKVSSGEAESIAQALDAAVATVRKLENRRRLAQATAAYFEGMDSQAESAENQLAANLASAAKGIDFDQEL